MAYTIKPNNTRYDIVYIAFNSVLSTVATYKEACDFISRLTEGC